MMKLDTLCGKTAMISDVVSHRFGNFSSHFDLRSLPNNSLAMFRRLSFDALFFDRLMETIHRFATNKNNEKLFIFL
jgi:hypothetical protein